VPGSLDKKGERRCHLLLTKRWNLLAPFLSNKHAAGHFYSNRIFIIAIKTQENGGGELCKIHPSQNVRDENRINKLSSF
jgi:hypothetical protein